MNYESIEPDILNYIGEGYDDYEPLPYLCKRYLVGMLMSDQDLSTQIATIQKAIEDNAELPGQVYAYMATGNNVSKPTSTIAVDVVRYVSRGEDGLEAEYNRLSDKYRSPEEVALRIADAEDKEL